MARRKKDPRLTKLELQIGELYERERVAFGRMQRVIRAYFKIRAQLSTRERKYERLAEQLQEEEEERRKGYTNGEALGPLEPEED